MATSDSRTIKSAHRVLEILEYFDQDRRHATVMDMSRTLSYPQSSTSELLRCLTRLGYLHYNRFRRTYSPTARVALLGAWVKPALFRGGPVLSAIDRVSDLVGETVILSTASNYVVQHLHVIHGQEEDAIDAHVGDTLPLLHSPQGKLLLSSYQNDHIRSAVHRLNAEEGDASRHVRLADVMEEMAALREKGWLVTDEEDGSGCIAVLLPARRGMDRLVISVLASREVIEQRSGEIIAALLDHRDEIDAVEGAEVREMTESNLARMNDNVKIVSYRRHFA
ncbi:IclR family transcriptional regulator [Rhizorhabdus wittichii]|jgi:DNA-binding IclR family transcriptional regulator|uniref:Regulatory protein, IclR n=2 Tax=Rhizorhabdus wittichii TaxID=160791 RepID=A0A9J9H839_RHIWR|nr:helix-turn-helix domain-containing protein [Rhizorhabdus wittichii]ABQ66686.1 regulatory protein, IclR [Rhizorhabdus wittichii RW1]ARR56748.1 IclR family transcriptional regulator [Rhizorhabdus wittichii DC-6]QTH22636.1 helix-turn-helix domain-containing protein [Rhizorhabdus wittichii]